MQYYGDDVTVADIKRELESLEGIPREQLLLVHAGEELTDDINLSAHGLAAYNRSSEIFIDLQVCGVQRLRSCLALPCSQVRGTRGPVACQEPRSEACKGLHCGCSSQALTTGPSLWLPNATLLQLSLIHISEPTRPY